ncbi:SIMPL domain-containing protein [Segnochrobactraceae bacterium EtOH-i3]
MRTALVAGRGPLLALALAAAALVPTAAAFAQDAPAAARARGPARVLTVTGSGEVSATPDVAVISSGVETQGETARAALDANSKAVAALIEAAKKAGVEARDIATSGFSVQPVYAERRQPKGEATQAIVGYQVMNRVTVTLRDVAKVGPLLDQLVTVGSNRIDGITFLVSDANTRRDAARTAAVADARRKAETLATAAGVSLGKVLTLSEGNDGGPMPRPMMRMAADSAGAVPVEAGSTSLGAEVEIRFEILDK